MVFNIYYKENTGDIVGYQDGGNLTPKNEIPEGCKRLAYAEHVKITGDNHRINMKVDIATKQLIPINLPKVIDEVDMVADLEDKLIKAKSDLIMAQEEGLKDYAKFLAENIEDITIRLDRAKAQLGKVEVVNV